MKKFNTIITIVLAVVVVNSAIIPTDAFAEEATKGKQGIIKASIKNSNTKTLDGKKAKDAKDESVISDSKDIKDIPEVKKDPSGLDMDCVIKTVTVREDSMYNNVGNFAETVKKAILEHKAGILTALKKDEIKARNETRKSANDTYRISMKKAKQDFEIARKNAMNEFKTSIKTCGAGADKAADTQDLPSL